MSSLKLSQYNDSSINGAKMGRSTVEQQWWPPVTQLVAPLLCMTPYCDILRTSTWKACWVKGVACECVCMRVCWVVCVCQLVPANWMDLFCRSQVFVICRNGKILSVRFDQEKIEMHYINSWKKCAPISITT